jgi:hypothetical protein
MGWGDVRYCFAMAILVIIIKSPNKVLGTSCFLHRFLLLLSPQTKFRDLLFLHRSLLNFTGRWIFIWRGAFRYWNFQNGHRCHGNRERMSKYLTSLISETAKGISSSLPINSSVQNNPRYQFSLKSENIEILPILSAAILKIAAIRSQFFLVTIFYQHYLIYMPSLVEIPLAVSDISEVKYFDIRSRPPTKSVKFQCSLISMKIDI